jgi:zinc and cadmium transporter
VETLGWILGSGALMSAIALVGGLTLVLPERMLQRLLLPLVSFAAGSLIGGALFHMLPASLAGASDVLTPFVWTAAGFVTFFALEQLLHYHHCHRAALPCREPLTYLVLLGDGLHNFLGGLAVGATFLVDIRLGVTTWLAAAVHEVPQELGDFGVLVHGGWSKRSALLVNLLSASTFLLGGVLAWLAAARVDVSMLVPYAAGNFLYIGASDLVPEVTHTERGCRVANLVAFAAGLAILLAVRFLVPHGHGESA